MGQKSVRPVTRTEVLDGNRGKRGPATTTVSRRYTDAQLSDLQIRYAREPNDSVAEYVYRVSRAGGDKVFLDSDEAAGDWGDDVFLTREPEGSRSLTARIAFWASSFRPAYRGEPTELEVTSLPALSSALRRLACVQAIYDKGKYDCPLNAPVDPERLHPLLRGLPASTQVRASANIETIEKAIEINSKSTNGPQEHVMTWAELLVDLNAHGLQFGFHPHGGKSSDESKSSDERSHSGSHRNRARAALKGQHVCAAKASPDSPRTGRHSSGEQRKNRDFRRKSRQSPRQSWYEQAISLGIPEMVLKGLPNWKIKATVLSLKGSYHGGSPGKPRGGSSPPSEIPAASQGVNSFSPPQQKAKN